MVYVDGKIGLGLDLLEHLLDCELGKLELDGGQVDLSILNCPHDWPKPTIFNPWHRLDYPQIVARVDVLGDGRLRWRRMLLIAQQNVIEKRTVRG